MIASNTPSAHRPLLVSVLLLGMIIELVAHRVLGWLIHRQRFGSQLLVLLVRLAIVGQTKMSQLQLLLLHQIMVMSDHLSLFFTPKSKNFRLLPFPPLDAADLVQASENVDEPQEVEDAEDSHEEQVTLHQESNTLEVKGECQQLEDARDDDEVEDVEKQPSLVRKLFLLPPVDMFLQNKSIN